MKIVFITPVTPYKENIGGPSGHPYHLMIERPNDIDVTIYSFNDNHFSNDQIRTVEQELRVKIIVIDKPKWIKFALKYHLMFVRLLLKYPIIYYYKLPHKNVIQIENENFDGAWGYCEGMNSCLNQLSLERKVLTPPDCVSLYYYRMLNYRYVFSDWMLYLRNSIMHYKFLQLEKKYPIGVKYHMVGIEDRDALLNINPFIDAQFLRHPHYEVSQLKMENGKLKIEFHQPKIKVLIAGQYNLYMRQTADELLEELKNSNIQELKSCYSYTFLGKGWERHVEMLRRVGYEVNHITFAPDYIEEIVKHDIQITPIAIGTGTKGKVLDALANGLLVIGTPYALENIAVKHGESCIEYRQPQEVIEVLQDIPNNIQKFERMAQCGRDCILKYHDRKLISQQLLSLFKDT